MIELRVITDLQYGSCGKGLLAGYLAKKHRPDTIVTAWGPNSGHTFIDKDGNKMVNTALPNGIVADSVKQVLIGPGSVIDPYKFLAELHEREQYINHGIRLLIHEHAAVTWPDQAKEEAKYAYRIGSTMKGVGEAMIAKIRRDPLHPAVAKHQLMGTALEQYVVPRAQYDAALDRAESVILEGAQGFSLGINSGFYPYTTSRECTTAQLLSDCAIPMGGIPPNNFTVYGAARTYPIRVSNRTINGVGEDPQHGMQIFSSGPCYPDQREIQWADLGLKPELTTVTKLPRRVFTFSKQQMRDACCMNGVDVVFLNFCNYDPAPNGLTSADLSDWVVKSVGATVITGWGPKETDIREEYR